MGKKEKIVGKKNKWKKKQNRLNPIQHTVNVVKQFMGDVFDIKKTRIYIYMQLLTRQQCELKWNVDRQTDRQTDRCPLSYRISVDVTTLVPYYNLLTVQFFFILVTNNIP